MNTARHLLLLPTPSPNSEPLGSVSWGIRPQRLSRKKKHRIQALPPHRYAAAHLRRCRHRWRALDFFLAAGGPFPFFLAAGKPRGRRAWPFFLAAGRPTPFFLATGGPSPFFVAATVSGPCPSFSRPEGPVVGLPVPFFPAGSKPHGRRAYPLPRGAPLFPFRWRVAPPISTALPHPRRSSPPSAPTSRQCRRGSMGVVAPLGSRRPSPPVWSTSRSCWRVSVGG